MKTILILKLFLFPLISMNHSFENDKCIPGPITIKQCQHKFYNHTDLSIMMDKDRESEIQIQIDQFIPLLVNECSKELNFFLCSAYVPFCDYDQKIYRPPCRNVCEKVQNDCEALMKKFNISWPKTLNCSEFPTEQTNGIQCLQNRKERQFPKVHKEPSNDKPLRGKQPFKHGQCQHLRNGENYVFINRTGRCALKCMSDDLFSRKSKDLAEIWMTIIASVTFISTLFTCITFCHSKRIHYPEQPIIFLTFSYNVYSISILLRLFLTRSKVSCDYDPVSGQRIIIQEGLENTYCAITFLLNFFFSTATHMWWIMLSLCWILFCALNVSALSLAKNSGIFHLFVWLMTSLLTVSVLILRSVDADELFGLCSVGEQMPDLLLPFSIIPKTICLALGFVFLILGFIFFKYRTRKLNKNNEKFYQQKVTNILSIGFRLGLFSIIYIIAITILICCELYQYNNYHSWLTAPGIFNKGKEPIVAVFLLKLFMSQVVGINSAIWIWSLDAAGSWKRLFRMVVEKVNYLKKNPSRSPLPMN